MLMLTMDTAPVGLVFLSMSLGTLVSISLTMFCSLGNDSMEGMEVWTQLLLLLLLELPLSPPTMDLGLVSLLLFLLTSPSPTSRPLPLLAIGRVNEDVEERDNDDKDADAAGANPEAEGAQRRTRNAAGRFMILECAMWIMDCLYHVFRFVDQSKVRCDLR